MILVVAPEPSAWLRPICEALGTRAWVVAPWAMPVASRVMARAARLPLPTPMARWADAVARQRAPVRSLPLPGFAVLQAAERWWVGDRASRRIRSRMARRLVLDRALAPWIPAGIETVVAPSLAARRLFSAARQRGASTRLVLDLPVLSRLHRDLDRAAAAHADAPFLLNHRARPYWLARQKAECLLAHQIDVRNRYAEDALQRDGCGAVLQRMAPPTPTPAPLADPVPDHTWVLAGSGTARNGALTAVALLDRFPGARLVYRQGQGVEPTLITHPRSQAVVAPSRWVPDAELVLAPSWVESTSREVAVAAGSGRRIVGTLAAAGFAEFDACPPWDVDAFARAFRRSVSGRAASLQRIG